MGKDFLGIGWKFPPGVNQRGGTALSRYEQDIEESIIIILRTAKGERIMRPDFGCQIYDLIYAPNNTSTAGLAIFYVKEALNKWEPRIEVTEVKVDTKSGQDVGQMIIAIRYTVRATNEVRNMVFPFYVNPDQQP